MNDQDLPDRLVIGVDFGTTYSGVAEAYSEREPTADEIQIIRQWPGNHGVTSEKVPSELAYGHPETTLPSVRPQYNSSLISRAGSQRSSSAFSDLSDMGAALDNIEGNAAGPVRWGFQLRQNELRLRCMKLFLDPQQELPAYISKTNMKNQLKRLKKSAEGAITDYLTELLKHAGQMLRRRYGEMFISTTRIDIVLTVPAVWSDSAKDATLRAAEKAASASGLPHTEHLSLISEPEAAAVYTLQAIQPSVLKQFDNFIVCDAGGGTVDLISYEIKQRLPLRIEESTQGTGKCCGGAFLNMRFEQFVRSRLGETAFMNLCRRDPRSWLEASKCFEDYVKRNYTADEDSDYNIDYSIPLPGATDDIDAGIESGYLTMTAAEVGELFEPIVEDIVGLIEDQINKLRSQNKQVAGILLVGGFGQSEHLFQTLKKRFSSNSGLPPPYSRAPSTNATANAGIEVMQPPNAWTAVVRGAVLRGLEGVELVLSRKARYNYGVVSYPKFDPTKHPGSCKAWDDLSERWEARSRMRWYIVKGQTLSSSEPILFEFFRDFEPYDERDIVSVLIFNKEDEPPAGYDKRVNSTTPALCSMNVDLSGVPERHFQQRSNSKGRKFERLYYYIGMQVNSGNIKFDLRVDSVVYGEVTAKFE